MRLTHIITESKQSWAVTIAFNNYRHLRDADYEVISVAVYEGKDFRADITDMLNKLNMLDRLVDDIDWLQEYAEYSQELIEQKANESYEMEMERRLAWQRVIL